MSEILYVGVGVCLYSLVPPAHIFVLTTALQPEVFNPPISEVVGKGDDTPERHQSLGSRGTPC